MSQQRRMFKEQHDVPGPGTYSEFERPGIGYSMRGRDEKDTVSDVPGPGNYSLQLKSASPSYTFTDKREETGQQDVPGPGSY